MNNRRPYCNLGIDFQTKAKEKTLLSGNAGDENNLHPGGSKFFFSMNLIEFFK